MHQVTGDGRYSASDLRNAGLLLDLVFVKAVAPHPPPSVLGVRLSGRGGGVTMEYITPVDLQIVNPNNEKGGWGGEAAQPVENKVQPTA